MISVIIIFLNAEKFLRQAIESVFAQTCNQWELLLVDDGSMDASSKIAMDIAVQHPNHVRYLEHQGHKNLGMSASRNLGIRESKGPYVALLDSDDVWLPTKLQEQLDILEKHPEASMIYGNNQFWKSWTMNEEDTDYQLDLGHAADCVFFAPELLLLYFVGGKITAPVPSDLLFRRDMALRIGGFDVSFPNMYEDQIFLIKVFAHENVYASTRTWTRYRQHPDSFAERWRKSNSTKRGAPIVLEWAENYLAEQGFIGTEIWRKLQDLLFRCRHPFLFRASEKWKAIRRRLVPSVNRKERPIN